MKAISLVGHAGCGKTTLAKALIANSGAAKPEEIDLDPSKEEKGRGYSIDLAVGSLDRGGERIHLLDTPGSPELVEEIHKAVGVAEVSVLVLNAEKGVEVQTEKAWEIIGTQPAFAFINRMDAENANFEAALDALRELDERFTPIQIPIGADGAWVGNFDLITNKAFDFNTGKVEISAELEERIANDREALLERLAESDDELMMKFLEEEEITVEEIEAALRVGIRSGGLRPVLLGSALNDLGIDLLLDRLTSLTPSFETAEGDGFNALVFNVISDPYLGVMDFIKVQRGTIQEGSTVHNISTGKKGTVRDIYRFLGGKQTKVKQAEAGEIVGLAKLERLSLGDTLAAQPNIPPCQFVDFPNPIFFRAIKPETQADEEKMSTALKELVATKATIDFYRDEITQETILAGMGDTHLDIITERLKNRYNVSIQMKIPKVPYKETIQRTATGQYRHKKQTGGRGQYGEVFLRVEPMSRGEGFEFVDAIRGGVIPNQFIPGVEKGVVEAMAEGVLAGYPMTDVRVAVYDGSYHSVDSSEIAFKIAASRALKLATQQASPVLLEPIMKLTVWVPEAFTGDIMKDVTGKRGRILGMDEQTIEAEVPLAEFQNYILELKSMTQGRATFQMEYLKHQTVPAELTENLLAREQQK
ncbi:MAG: elongation factor G [Candidatus Bipolaricaulia bacterium]